MMTFIGWMLMFITQVAQTLFMVYLCALVLILVEDNVKRKHKKGE